MKIDKLAMVEVVHYINFFSDQCLFHGMTNWNELGSKYMLSLKFTTSVNNSKGTSSNLFKYVIMVIDTVLGLDLNWLRNVFSINIKDKLVIVSDFTLLSSDLLASLGINLN